MEASEVKERVEAMMEAAGSCLSELEGTDRDLTEDMLRTYCWFSVQLADAQARIDREGLLLETEKGGANNRHTVMAENPLVGIVHKLSQRKSDYYTKIRRALPEGGDEALDRIAEFCRP